MPRIAARDQLPARPPTPGLARDTNASTDAEGSRSERADESFPEVGGKQRGAPVHDLVRGPSAKGSAKTGVLSRYSIQPQLRSFSPVEVE
jgi:hypothetical protein